MAAQHLIDSFWSDFIMRLEQKVSSTEPAPPIPLGEHPVALGAMRALGSRIEMRSGVGYMAPWLPQRGPQTVLVEDYKDVPEIFYGGARGGGKTDGMLGDWLLNHALEHPAARGVFFRRRVKHLEEVERRAAEIFPETGARLNKSTKVWTWPNGATLRFRHLWDLAESDDYKGSQFSWICFEQIEDWPDPDVVNRLRGTLRSPEGAPVRFRATGNPGGAGHGWVKARYISPAPNGMELIDDPELGLDRLFIPAQLEDNIILMTNDPTYERQLMASGPEHIVKAWRYGLWDIAAGGYFIGVWNPNVTKGIQVLKSFEPLPEWTFFRSFDWGYSKPASLGLWAITDGQPLDDLSPYPGKVFPAGSLIRIGEWYTCERDSMNLPKPNKGMKLSPEELGQGIAKRSRGRLWEWGAADPSIFDISSGDSIYEQMVEGSENYYGANGTGSTEREIEFDKADNKRIPGWQAMLRMLRESGQPRPEGPGLWVFETCTDWLRTVPVVPSDMKKPDDVDTDSEDHLADETRYAVMSLGAGGSNEELRI